MAMWPGNVFQALILSLTGSTRSTDSSKKVLCSALGRSTSSHSEKYCLAVYLFCV